MTAEPLAVLRRIRESPPVPRPRAGEKCELCAQAITDEHNHLVDIEQRTLMCTCRGCWLLFTPEGAGGGHFKAVPDRYAEFSELRLSPGQWDSLQIPVSVAFFFVNSTLDRVCAFYPSPAGATESLLPLDTWDELTAAHTELASLQADVEAFLVRFDRARNAGECYLVPIDTCYELVGRLRTRWRGFDGGREANEAIDAFFADVQARSR
jgi:hypothetical protein